MKIRTALFTISAPGLADCPPTRLPEFAFIGRSNVGKSSLINLLTQKKDLAKVSETPGKTKLINFFQINDSWLLVDLPGYGYAKVGKKDRTEFNQAVAEYLAKRPQLRRTFVLIDSRLPPQKIDLEFLQWLVDCGGPFALVFTKTDKLSAKAAQENILQFTETLHQQCGVMPEILKTSAKSAVGRAELLQKIELTLAEKMPELEEEDDDQEDDDEDLLRA